MSGAVGNPSSIHALGREAAGLMEAARETVSSALAVPAARLRFTSGGTESNNMAILGAVRAYRNRGQHLVTVATEHPSVLEATRALESQGWRVTVVGVDGAGRLDAGELLQAISQDTVLVSLMHVNNETGTMHPLEQLGPAIAGLRRRGLPLLHVDAVQSFARYPLQPREWGIDLVSLTGHKLGGPCGVGALYVRDGVRLEPLLYGGGQELGLRSGTENVAGIVGLAAAVEQLGGRPGLVDHWMRLRQDLLDGLQAAPLPFCVNGGAGAEGQFAPHIINVSFPGVPGEVMTRAVEARGVMISTGSACHSRSTGLSHVLQAMGLDAARGASAVRISLGPDTSRQEIELATEALVAVAAEIGSLHGGSGPS